MQNYELWKNQRKKGWINVSLPERKQEETHSYAKPKPFLSEEQRTTPVPYLVPQSRLKKVSKLEKFIFFAFIVTFLCLSVATIKLTTAINREEEAISTVQTQITESQADINKLRQEKNELLRSERVKGIAEKAGIELREDNIRKIK